MSQAVRQPIEDILHNIYELLERRKNPEDFPAPPTEDDPEKALGARLNELHYADIADLLETLPPDDRL